MKTPSKKKQAEVEKQLKADIRWAIKNGMKWDPERTAWYDDASCKWVADAQVGRKPRVCGVCAVAAHVIRQQPARGNARYPQHEVVVAAGSLEVPVSWLEDLFVSVMDMEIDRNAAAYRYPTAATMGYRLADYAEEYTKRKARK